jgi:hypothetical protein
MSDWDNIQAIPPIGGNIHGKQRSPVKIISLKGKIQSRLKAQ